MYSHMPHWYFIDERFLSAVIINYNVHEERHSKENER